MAVDFCGFEMSFIAGADLSTMKFRFVKLHTTGDQVVGAGAGESAVGVAQDGVVQGRPVPIRRMGRSKVVAAATLTPGTAVAADASSEAVAAVSGNFILGYAVTAADTGDIFDCLLADGSAKV